MMISRQHSFTRRLAAPALVAIAGLGLVSCASTADQSSAESTSTTAAATSTTDSSAANATEANATAANATATEADASAAAETATMDPSVTIEVTPNKDLKSNDTIEVALSGLNPKLGYYAAICSPVRNPASPVPVCTGGRGDATAQAWIKAEGGTITLNEDGTADAVIAVSPIGEGIDCRTEECVVKIFGDHTEGFKDVTQAPVTFAP